MVHLNLLCHVQLETLVTPSSQGNHVKVTHPHLVLGEKNSQNN